MSEINFFTPISFGSQTKSCCQALLQNIDDFFYFGGQKAQVVDGYRNEEGEGVVLAERSQPFFLTALKVISLIFLCIPLLITKTVLRCVYKFHLIPEKTPQEVLEEGVEVSLATLSEIQERMPKIKGVLHDLAIEWYSIKHKFLVFKLKSTPEFIFKMADPNTTFIDDDSNHLSAAQKTEELFENMIKAQKICLENELNLLVIPHAKIFEMDGISFIAQQWLDFNPDESAQEEHYRTLSGLDETIREVAAFIAESGFRFLSWRKMPLLDTQKDFLGSRHIALFNFRKMDSASEGIFGNNTHSRGLIHCVFSEEQMNIISETIESYNGIDRQDVFEKAKQERRKEIELDQELQQFYADKGILQNPRKEIIRLEELSSLNLDFSVTHIAEDNIRDPETGKLISEKFTYTLEIAAKSVIQAINEAIKATPEEASIKGKRFVTLSKNGKFSHFEHFTLDDNVISGRKQSWLSCILEALVEKECLFRVDSSHENVYTIQA